MGPAWTDISCKAAALLSVETQYFASSIVEWHTLTPDSNYCFSMLSKDGVSAPPGRS